MSHLGTFRNKDPVVSPAAHKPRDYVIIFCDRTYPFVSVLLKSLVCKHIRTYNWIGNKWTLLMVIAHLIFWRRSPSPVCHPFYQYWNSPLYRSIEFLNSSSQLLNGTPIISANSSSVSAIIGGLSVSNAVYNWECHTSSDH